jgi:hypothetical protein
MARGSNGDAMKTGDHLGGWRLVDLLGRGGNGQVWRCVRADGTEAAINVLLNQRDPERLGRFRNEIGFLLGHRRRCGIVRSSTMTSAVPAGSGT